MCTFIDTEEIWVTRDGCLVYIDEETKSGGRTAFVIVTNSIDHPVGTRVEYMSPMGHVMCEGDDDHSETCKLHPLDTVGRMVVKSHDMSDHVAKARALIDSVDLVIKNADINQVGV